MWLRAGAEMTTLEMRMVALRCRGTMAPTGTMALGLGAEQTNALGEAYEARYGRTTSQRVLALRRELEAGRGPCSLSAKADKKAVAALRRAYLDMCPSQTLSWLEKAWVSGEPSLATAELEASEPYVLGGHTGGGFFVDSERRTTLEGLWAAGDAAGGAPQKYVTGSMAEGAMAAESVHARLPRRWTPEGDALKLAEGAIGEWSDRLGPGRSGGETAASLEDALQALMDAGAGGPGSGYRYSEASLRKAASGVRDLGREASLLKAPDARGLGRICELLERICLAESLLAHLEARKETRWPGFGEYEDHPEASEDLGILINSVLGPKGPELIRRDLSGERL